MIIVTFVPGCPAIEMFDHHNLGQIQFFLLLNAGQENHRHKLFPAVLLNSTLDTRFLPALHEMTSHTFPKVIRLSDIQFLVLARQSRA